MYHASEVELFMVNNGIDDIWVVINSGRVIRFLVEIIICILHPVPFSHLFSNSAKTVDPKPSRTFIVKSDLCLSLPMFLRLYLIPRVMLLHSHMFTDISSRSIGAMNQINFNGRFVLKTLMTICPGTVIMTFIITLFIIASWSVRVCELPA
ncbi:hypothetical protein GJ496_004646 [Pomphorhynchus laevis]|nr:hypothetical protein GJ496_004646 [Pomphorhynchus laevis]